MKATELRQKTVDELNTMLLEQRQKEFNLRMQRGSGQPPKPSEFSATRRDIARIKTVLTEKKHAGDNA